MTRRKKAKKKLRRQKKAEAEHSPEHLKRLIERHQGQLVDIIHAHASPYRGVKCLGWRKQPVKEATSSLLASGWLHFAYPGAHVRLDPVTGEPILDRIPLYVVTNIVRHRAAKTE